MMAVDWQSGKPPVSRSDDPSAARLTKKLSEAPRMGRYVILDLLGSGGMGAVFEAYDPELTRKVAIKVVHAQGEDENDPEQLRRDRARLIREAKSLAQLSHPNIVPIYDVGLLDDQSVFLAMEFVAGLSLRDILINGTLTWRERLRIVLQAGLGLEAAHAIGLVHRDVKPENIMVGHDGRVYLLDFGLAKNEVAGHRPANAERTADSPAFTQALANLYANAQGDHLTRAGVVVGTPAYLAPEQLEGKSGQVGSDIFAWSCVAFEALCGQPPFPRHSLAARKRAIRNQQLAWSPAIPLWLRKIIAQGLNEQPNLRPSRVSHMHAAIDKGLQGERQKQRLVPGVVLATVATLAGLAWVDRKQPDSRQDCERAGETIAAMWNRNVAAQVQRAFEAQHVGLAQEFWPRAREGLDEWEMAWRHSAGNLCRRINEPTPVDVPTLVTQEASRACLQESKAEVAALLAVWQQPSVEHMQSAASAVRSLSDPSRCVDAEALRRRAKLPLDAKLRAQVLGLRSEIGAAKMRVEQADYVGAKQRLEGLRARVHATKDIALFADYLGAWARYFKDLNLGEPRAFAQEGALLAAIAAGRTDQSAFFANSRFYTRTYALNEVDSGQGILADASAYTIRGQSQARERSMLHRNHGIWEAMQGHETKAQIHFEQALTFARQGWGATSEQVAESYDDLGVLAENTSDIEGMLSQHLKASELRTALLGNVHPQTLRSQHYLAVALEESGRLGEAQQLSGKILQLCLKAGYGHVLCGPLWDGYGRLHVKRGDYFAGLHTRLTEFSLEGQAKQRCEPTQTWSETELSQIYENRGLLQSAQHLAEIGLAKLIAEGHLHPFTQIEAVQRVAWTTLRLGLLKEANHHLETLHRLADLNVESKEVLQLQNTLLHGEVLLVHGKVASAASIFSDALAWADSAKLPLDERAKLADGWARALLAQGRPELAETLARRALDYLAQIDDLRAHVTVPWRLTLAHALLAQRRWHDAIFELEYADAIFDPVEVIDNRRAPLEFALAQAQWEIATTSAERQAARHLAHSALERYRDWDGGADHEIANVEAWLRQPLARVGHRRRS